MTPTHRVSRTSLLTALRTRPHRIPTAAVVILLVGLLCLVKVRILFSFWYEPLLQIYSLTAAGYVFSRIILAMRYREPEDTPYRPHISIIIAAKNEEKHMA